MVIRSAREIPKRGEFWDFPKGELEKGEKGIDAARREAREEVGIEKFTILPEFKETVRYFTRKHGKPILKFVVLFLARVAMGKVKLSWEHDKYLWLPYKEAYERVSLLQMERALGSAEKFLEKNDIYYSIPKKGI